MAKIDSLKNPSVSGMIVPARSGVEVHIDVKRSDTYQTATTTTTDSSGQFNLAELREGVARDIPDPRHL